MFFILAAVKEMKNLLKPAFEAWHCNNPHILTSLKQYSNLATVNSFTVERRKNSVKTAITVCFKYKIRIDKCTKCYLYAADNIKTNNKML